MTAKTNNIAVFGGTYRKNAYDRLTDDQYDLVESVIESAKNSVTRYGDSETLQCVTDDYELCVVSLFEGDYFSYATSIELTSL